MLEKPEQLQQKAAELTRAAWLAGVLSAALESGLITALGEGGTGAEVASRSGVSTELATATLDVLAELGAVGRQANRFIPSPALTALGPQARFLGANLHSSLGQVAQLTRHLSEGWTQEPDVVRAQGVVSEAITLGPMARMFREIPGWDERLSAPGARFLDVGAGAAGICVGMCRLYPQLSVVGYEPFEVPLREGERVVAAAGLAERITLRQRGFEAIDEVEAFDAAYVAQMFFPQPLLLDGYRKLFRSLKPGGFITTGSVFDQGEGAAAALGRLQSVLWGGGTRTIDDVARMLREVGFVDVLTPPVPGGMRPLFARKPSPHRIG